MDNIADLLSSISPDDLEKLKSVASGIMGNNSEKSNSADSVNSAAQSSGNSSGNNANPFSSMFGEDMTKTLMTVATQMNKEDDRTHFISALKPLLSDERRKKADDAMKFLKLMDMLPLVKGIFKL